MEQDGHGLPIARVRAIFGPRNHDWVGFQIRSLIVNETECSRHLTINL